jgi:hypothetical protein
MCNLLCGHSEKVHSGAARKLRSATMMQQWRRRKKEELVNNKNSSLPLIKLLEKGMWAETWRKKWKR